MSNDYESLLSGLEDKKPEEQEQPKQPTRQRRQRKAAAAETTGQSEQRGPRADPAFVQVNANIPKELHASLFYYLKAEGRTLSALVNDLLAGYVEEQGGIITRRKPK